MKINFKHVATAALAVAMSLSLAVPAFAEGTGGAQTLTVKGDTLDSKKVYAVQMFTARVSGSADDHTFDSYDLVDEWLPFFQNATDAGIGKDTINATIDPDLGEKPTDAQWEDAILAYVQAQAENGADLITLADKAQAWVRSHDGMPAATENTDAAKVFAGKIIEAQASEGEAVFSNLQPGYYLVYPEGGSTGDKIDDTPESQPRGTDAMLVNVPRDNDAEWNIKSTFPTVEKKVDTDGEDGNPAADNGSAQVGDIVTFTLTSKVPDMSDYTEFYFAFNDTLSRGLKIVDRGGNAVQDNDPVSINNLTVTIGEELVTSGYKVSLHGTVLKVEFTDLKKVAQAAETEDVGKEIVVTYQAMITEDAVVGNPALNTVKVEYSNDPSKQTHGTSTPDESKVYTYEIDVHKWSTDNGVENYLGDAVFALSKESDLGTLSISTAEGETNGKVVNDNGVNVESSLIGLTGSGNTYKINPESKVYTFATTDSSAIKIQGLEVGTYYLYEVTAPASYNKLKNPVKIEITLEGGDYTKPVYKVTINGVPTTGTPGDSTIKVENKQGITLPETGSIGTIGLTVAGVAVVLAGVMLPRKKKNKEQE